jgi:hypothetical protein
MSDSSELLIRISGDVKDFKEKLDEVQEKTEDFSEAAVKVAKVSAIAFAALTAEVFLSVKAFGQKEAVTNSLTAALQNQGIYSRELLESYQAQADAVERLTGIDADLINKGQSVAQSFLGQTKITQELTAAVADFAAAQGIDVANAFEVVGKSIGTSNNALKRYGIDIDENASKQEKLSKVVEQLNARFQGQAEAQGKGVASIAQVSRAFGDLQEEIGKRLAPTVVKVAAVVTDFLDYVKDNKAIVDLGVSIGVAAGVIAALGVAVGTGAALWAKYKAVMTAVGLATQATSVATKALVGATGLGLLPIILSEIYLNWSTVWPWAQGVFQGFVTTVSELASGLGKILIGASTLDVAKLQEGLDQVKEAFAKGVAEGNAIYEQGIKERQTLEDEAEKKKIAQQEAAGARARAAEAETERLAALGIQIEKNRAEQILLTQQGASAERIQLLKDENTILSALRDEKDQEVISALEKELATTRAMKSIAHENEKEQLRIFKEEILAQDKEFENLSAEQKLVFQEKHKQNLQDQILTEKTARVQALAEKSKTQIDANNRFLMDQEKYGTAYATINQAMNSEIYKGNKQAFGELAQLQSSSNSTLKGIGKAAAIANITMKTAESAMNIFTGFSTIPFVGQALGIAGAAAAVAFGAEQMSRVTAAAKGGIMTGGIPGRDSIPTLTMPGELVVPTRNFEEVVNAVAASRSGSPIAGPDGALAHVVLELKDSLAEFIEVKLIERRSLGIALQGA